MTSAGQTLALEVSGGAGGFLVVVLLGLAAAGLFTMMSRSLGRMRSNVAGGRFGERAAAGKRRSGRADADGDIPSQDSSGRD